MSKKSILSRPQHFHEFFTHFFGQFFSWNQSVWLESADFWARKFKYFGQNWFFGQKFDFSNSVLGMKIAYGVLTNFARIAARIFSETSALKPSILGIEKRFFFKASRIFTTFYFVYSLIKPDRSESRSTLQLEFNSFWIKKFLDIQR